MLLLGGPALTAWWWEPFSCEPLDRRNEVWLDTYMENSEVTKTDRVNQYREMVSLATRLEADAIKNGCEKEERHMWERLYAEAVTLVSFDEIKGLLT